MIQRNKKSDVPNGEPAEIYGSTEKERKPIDSEHSKMYNLFGFEWLDFKDWNSFVCLMNRPTDPSSLGLLRFGFGFLMFLDVFHERGLHVVDYIYGDPDECRFPLFDSLKPLPLEWMYIVYLLMIIGAFGIMLGFLYRVSCLVFVLTYWYVFFLDKSVWNNHSYLYGLCAFLLLVSDANRYWSVDGLLRPHIKNSEVPLWNYTLLRTQFFLVYFIAGLKKLDYDWVHGYSMNTLSNHWVFQPFTAFLSNEDIDLWIVHIGGLIIDLTVGYLLFFDYTRPVGVLMGGSFHFMNSRMFAIGMFPYTMLATMPIFSHTDWPKKLPAMMSGIFTKAPPQHNLKCLYKDDCHKLNGQNARTEKKEKKRSSSEKVNTIIKTRFSHHFYAVFTIVYILIQCFLPYSHFLTKGYNNWTNGLYGYSWDMMVHTWSTQHTRIMYIDHDTGKQGFLNPEAWTRGSDRWSSHTDMIKQHALCIQERLREYNMNNVSLYFDIWRSLNHRFQQRMVDPRIDIVSAPWSPFETTPWLMSLLTNLSDWRGKLDELENNIYDGSNMTDVVFIADVPGLYLENFIQKDLTNTTIHVLHGQVIVELQRTNIRAKTTVKENVTLIVGDQLKIPADEYHKVYTISEQPSCYMYIYVNTTEVEISKKLQEAEANDGKELSNDLKEIYDKMKKTKNEMSEKANEYWITSLEKFVKEKYKNVYRGLILMRVAIQSIVTRESFQLVFNKTVIYDSDAEGQKNEL